MAATVAKQAISTISRTAKCPRCRYDLRGTIKTWTDQYPLHGTCAECGLEFAWAEVLLPDKFEPRWCIEYAPQGIRVLVGAFKTLSRSLWPWHFFSSLKMSHMIRPRRLALYLALLVLLPGIAYVVEQTTVAVRVRYKVGSNQWTTSISHSYFSAIIEAVFTPTSSNSSATYTNSGFVVVYLPPNRLHEAFEILQPVGPSLQKNPFVRSIIPSLLALTGGVAVSLLLPVGFILLPITRRRAKVRWEHFGRITAYSFIIPSLLASTFLACGMIAYLRLEWGKNAMGVATWMNIFLPIPLLIIWWAAAAKCYLHLPHAWLISILLALLAMLFLAATIILLIRLM